VYFGRNGLLAAADTGTVLVDCTTSEPSLAVRIGEAAREKGLRALDAPVSGGDRGAREGTLAVMVGGDEDAFTTALPVLRCFGKTVGHLGPCGAGQHTKMTNQILVAAGMIGVVESLLYARRSGLDLNAVIDVVGTGAAGSWAVNNLGRRIADNDFSPGFFIKYLVKDLGIALDEARRMSLSLPGLALAQQFYIAAMAQGLGDRGTQGLFSVLDSLNLPG
jgi:3-hydroxyisobutyrate dehydrogenase